MSDFTVQNRFGLKPEELNTLAALAGLEAYRGGPNSQDVAAVAANVLARRLTRKWGGIDLRNIATAPGQYEAVKGMSMQQLGDEKFGRKLLGDSEFERVRSIVNDPKLVGEQFKNSKGAQSFRGVALYSNRKPGDYMPVPGKSNFYFNPLDQTAFNKGLDLFGSGSTNKSSPTQPSKQATVPPTTPGVTVNIIADPDALKALGLPASTEGSQSSPGVAVGTDNLSSLVPSPVIDSQQMLASFIQNLNRKRQVDPVNKTDYWDLGSPVV